MHQSIWKLTALAVVVGIGILVVIQAQQGINNRQQDAADDQQVSDSLHGEEPGDESLLETPLVPPPRGDSDLSALDDNLAVPASAKTIAGSTAKERTLAATDDDALDFDKDSFSLESPPVKKSSQSQPASRRLNAGGSPTDSKLPRAEKTRATKPGSTATARQADPLSEVDLIDLSTDEDLLDDRRPSRKPATSASERASNKSPTLRLNPLDEETETSDSGSTTTADSREIDSPRSFEENRRTPKLMPILNEEDDSSETGSSSSDDQSKPGAGSTAPSKRADRSTAPSRRSPPEEDDFPTLSDDASDSGASVPMPRKVTAIPDDEEAGSDEAGDEMPIGNRAPPQRKMPVSARSDTTGKGLDETATEEESDDATFSTRTLPQARKLTDEPEDDDVAAIPGREPARDDAALERPSSSPNARRPAAVDGDEESISVSGRPTPAERPTATRPKDVGDEDDASFRSGPTREDPAPGRMGSSVPVPAVVDHDDASFQDSRAGTSRPAASNDEPAPKLSIEKIAPPTAVLGQPMVYQIVVRNVGDVPARQVVVEEETQSGVKVQGSIPQAMLDGGKLIWKLGTLDPGKERKIAVKVIPQSEGTIGAEATVRTARGNVDDDPKAERKRGPSLKFDVEAPRQASIGTPIPFHFKVKNVGRSDASGVVIRDVLPAGLRHPDGDDLEYEIGVLRAGESREVELMLTAAQPGRTLNRAVVTADGNVTEEASVSLDVVGPTLNISRAGPKRLFPNKAGQYTNTVTNPGSTPALNVRVVETVPPGMEFVEASDGGEYNAARRSITWNIDRLESNETKAVRSRLQPTGRGAQVSVVRTHDVTGGTGETVGTTHVSGLPALTIDVSDISPNVEVGEEVRVPVRILNRGSDGATNIRATITLPAGMELISARGPVEYKARAVGVKDGSQARTRKEHQELQFSPIARLEPRADAVIELLLKARRTGNAKVQVAVECDEVTEPVRREEVVPIAALSD